MRIFKQINQYDCGISVTQALINHYYHKVVSKEQLMTEANITNQGLSILDLEQINHNYGINLTTYDVAYEEFVPHQTKDYFILMLQFDFGNHYVIAKKNQQGVLLYDSWLGRRFISYQELKKYYSQVYIEINLANYHEK